MNNETPQTAPVPESDAPRASRRTVLEAAIGVLGAGVILGVGVPVAGSLLSPIQERGSEENWIPIAAEDSVSEGQMVRVIFKQVKKDGWMESETPLTVYLTRKGDEFKVFSSICTHLGCSVNWDEEAKQFKCPCHTAVFNAEGQVVSGPPPKPLPQLKVRVNEGQIEVTV